MVLVPEVRPLTIPVEPTVAIEVALLVQLPPVTPSLNEVVDPWHTLVLPLIDVIGLTVTTVVVTQPVVAV